MAAIVRSNEIKTISTVLRPMHYMEPSIRPLYIISFLYISMNTLFNLATSNLLLFHLGITPTFYGVIISIYALCYFLGPIITRPVAQKIGIRKILLIMVSIAGIETVLILIYLSLEILIISYIFDGILTSAMWANLNNVLGQWQKAFPDKRNEYFRKYSLSWNLGIIFSGLISYLLVFIGRNDRFPLILSEISIIFIIIQCQRVSFPSICILDKKEIQDQLELQKINQNQKKPVIPKQSVINPLVVILTALCIYQVLRGVSDIIFPYQLIELTKDSYWLYLETLMFQVFYMVAIYWSSKQSWTVKYLSFLLGLFGLVGFIYLGQEANTIGVFLIITALFAWFAGQVYGFLAQTILQISSKADISRNTGLFESISALGFGITPIFTGMLMKYHPSWLVPIILSFIILVVPWIVLGTKNLYIVYIQMRLILYENPFQNENLDENIPIGMKIWCLFSTPINSFLTERVESNFYFTLMDSRSNQTMTNNMQIWFYKWYSKVHSLFRQWLRLEKIIGISPQNLQNSYSFWADYVIP